MGKHGPCCHCRVNSTPLWRDGPVDKPVLCNACGSRWRTKGSLINYIPLHARAEPEDYEVNKHPKAKTISVNRRKETNLFKRKQFFEAVVGTGGAFRDSPSFSNFLDQDARNRSSSGSAISNSESCGQFSKVEASELTDPDKSIISDSVGTPKKKIVIPRFKPSPVEKLTRELCTILHEQHSYFSGSSEEDLLFDTSMTMASVETGHGSVLIKEPRTIGQEEDSEASSLTFDNKQLSGQQSYFFPNNLLVSTKSKDLENYISGVGRIRKLTELEMHQRQLVEGVFDVSLPGVKAEDCKTLRMFALLNLTKSKWVKHYILLKKCKDCLTGYVVPGMPIGVATSKTADMRRPRDEPTTNVPDAACAMKCPKTPSIEDMDENKAPLDNNASCFNHINMAMPPNYSSHPTNSF